MPKAVLLIVGDSIPAGWNTVFDEESAEEDAPFGNPSSNIFVYGRWTDPDTAVKLGDATYSGQNWVPHSASTGNWQKTGASPAYSFAEKAVRFFGLDSIYLILFGVSGSDASPLHPNPAGSWHPSIASGLIPRLKNHYLLPALATPELQDGTAVIGILASFGQNCCHNSFPAGAVSSLTQDIESVTGEISRIAQLSSHPSVVLFQNPLTPATTPDGFSSARVLESRYKQRVWCRTPATYGKALVNIDSVELQVDAVHPTHQGALDAGSRAFYALTSATPSFTSIHRE